MIAPTRRERLRAATVEEIKQTARRLLVAEGPAAISLRAIAREIGMTAPALYRYFPSHEALMEGLCVDLSSELVTELMRARDAEPSSDPAVKLLAACLAFRTWAIDHPAEFSLIFASTRRHPQAGAAGASAADASGDGCVGGLREVKHRFGEVFLEQVLELWQRNHFPLPPSEDLPEALCEQLRRYVDEDQLGIPIGVAHVFLSGWARLYGLVALEVFGHLDFALDDVEPMFQAEINQLARQLGVDLRG
ncbi:MAG: TetR/AcrR family transcriptional regulator [Micromonosporaceae bacterium]